MLNALIDKISVVIQLADPKMVLRGLKIAKVFRNKEGHVVVPSHKFNPSNYRAIEASLVQLYETAFAERLSVRFSLAPREKAIWRVVNIQNSVA